MKGILAVLVLAHHLYQHSGLFRGGWLRYPGAILQSLGFTTVALFFFLSGYGLIVSYRKNPFGIALFPKNKIIPFYIINLILVGLYGCMGNLIGNQIGVDLILKSSTFGGTVIVNGWYIQVQLLYYILFFATFNYCRNRKQQYLVSVTLHVIYIIICKMVGLSSLYYERTFIFLLGIFWYDNRRVMDGWISAKKYRLITIWILSCSLFAITYLFSIIRHSVLFRGVSYLFLVPSVILLLKKVRIQNKVTCFLGEISFEIYVLQGVFLVLFKLIISNPYIYLFVVTTSTIISAWVMHPLVQYIYRAFRKQ